MKIQIKNRKGIVLFEYEKENNTILDSIQEAIKQDINLKDAYLKGANLCGADLYCANLKGANLRGADLRNANLRNCDISCADLCGADLYGINLRGANLRGTDLRGSDLRGADLRGADLYGADLYRADIRGANFENVYLGDLGIIQDMLIIGYIGSRNDYTIAYKTNKEIFIQCGCFRGTINEFEVRVKETHQGTDHKRNYFAMIKFIKIKFQ